MLGLAPPITEIAEATRTAVPQAARTYLAIGEDLHIAALAAKANAIATPDYYDRLAVTQALAQLDDAQAAFTRQALRGGAEGIDAWLAGQGDAGGDRRRQDVHGLASVGRRRPAQRAGGGGACRSLSINQEAPSSGSWQIRCQRKPARS